MSPSDLERRLADLERRIPKGMMVSSSFGSSEVRPFQTGFPVQLTSTFDSDTGYSWKQLVLDVTVPGVETPPAPRTGDNAFTTDNNQSLQAGQRGWLEVDPQAAGWIFLPAFLPCAPIYRTTCTGGVNVREVSLDCGKMWNFDSFQGCCACTPTDSGASGSGGACGDAPAENLCLTFEVVSGANPGRTFSIPLVYGGLAPFPFWQSPQVPLPCICAADSGQGPNPLGIFYLTCTAAGWGLEFAFEGTATGGGLVLTGKTDSPFTLTFSFSGEGTINCDPEPVVWSATVAVNADCGGSGGSASGSGCATLVCDGECLPQPLNVDASVSGVPCSIAGGCTPPVSGTMTNFADSDLWLATSICAAGLLIADLYVTITCTGAMVSCFVQCPSGDQYAVSLASVSMSFNPVDIVLHGTLSTESNCCNGSTLVVVITE